MQSRFRLSWAGISLALVLPAFVAVGGPASNAAQPEAARASSHDHNTVTLKSRTFTPKPGLDRAAILAGRDRGKPVHFLAQFSPLPTAADRAAFARAGIKLLDSVGGNTYLARATGARLGKLEALPGFRWAGALKPGDKIDPTLREGRVPAYARAGSRVALTVQVHADASFGDARRIVAKHGGKVVGGASAIPSITALFPAGAATALAAEDAVSYVAPIDPLMGEHNDGAVGALNVGPLYAAPYGLDGTGSTVLVYDSGRAQHSDFDARTTQTDADASTFVRSHSTHVAGTVLGDGSNSQGNDSEGNPNNGTSANQWAGVAPGANLATFGSVGSNTSTDVMYDDTGDLQADFTTAIAGGVDLATMSLGNNTGANGFPCAQLGDYTNTSILIDQIVAGSLGQELIYFQSAGNERNDSCAPANGYATISSPAPAKNSIVVGAINSNDNSMTNFSSWGPTDDGRLRPDLAGPGCQNGGDGALTSTDIEDADGDGNLEANDAVNRYGTKCGTSMATPALAGLGALIVEQWRATYGAGTRPLPHSMKALLAHSATDLGTAGPDYSFGYGQPDAQAAADLVRAGNLIKVDNVDNGATDTWYFASDGSAAPRITLAWSDPAAARNSTTQLVNNLDLVVTRPDGTVHRPQVLDAANPANASVEGTDNLNVMEMVLGAADAGHWKVEVSGTAVPQGPSTYSLVTPAEVTDNAPPTADAGGPYNTVEGQSVQLNGSGTDPEGGTLTYEWDLDNNGTFETSGATPTFPAKGQDGVHTVVLRVTDDEGSSVTDTSTVTVANVAPTVTIDAITPVDEGGTVTVSGQVTDPGWLDVLTATVDFEDGAGAVALPLTFVENNPPLTTYTFSVQKQYGDNGDFTVTVTGADDDTTASDTETAAVANLDPTAAIGLGGQQVYDGKSAYVAEAGDTISVPVTGADAGSDDLTFLWEWGDTTTSQLVSLVNPPALDPAKSPSVQPRDVTLSSDHAYTEACLYELDATVTDDDGGSASDSAVVLITGNADVSKGHGWWLNEYRPKGDTFTPAELQCYLDIVNYLSLVFSEDTTANTRASAAQVLNAPAKAPEDVIWDQHALGAWLNFANGSVKLDTLVDTDGDGVRDTAFGDVMYTAETVRLDPTSTRQEVLQQKDILARIVTQSAP